MLLFFGLSIVGALAPIGISYMAKLVVDRLIAVQTTTQVITTTFLALFASQYLIGLLEDFLNSYQYEYVERLFRFRMQDFLSQQFSAKISDLDTAHLENPETYNVILKARGGYSNRIPLFIEYAMLIGSQIGTYVASFILLAPYGIWVPLVMTAVVVPRFVLKNRQSSISWSIYNQNIPESKELAYVSDLLDDPKTIQEVRIFQARHALLKRMVKLQEHILNEIRKPLKKYMASLYIPIVIESAGVALLAYIKLGPTVAGLISIGTFLFYTQLLGRMLASSNRVFTQINHLYDHNLHINSFFDVLNLPKLVKEKDPGHVFDEIAPPLIEFQNVSFTYVDGPVALKNVSFKLNPGEHLAIVGPNGAGKSTLIKLLLRFYDPTKGSILVNDYDLRELRLSNWYRFVGTLFQDFVKFQLTIKDNIILGKADVVDEQKIREAAKKSGAAEFIEKLPRKYAQRLGKRFDDSVELSQGQWQKLALARAFYEEAPVLILDEPTSAIDAEAEAEIFENLDRTYQNKTLIFISHRFSTVRNADKIIVLRNGQISEQGTHEALMKQKGIYARMFLKQAKGYIE